MGRMLVSRIVGALGAVLVLAIFVAPASAQTRDPFEPLVRPAVTGATGSGPSVSGTTTDPNLPAVSPAQDGVPDTGFDATTWAAAGYCLIALGLAAYACSHLAPPRWPRRTRSLIHPFGL